MTYRLIKYLSAFLLLSCSNQPDINSLSDIDNELKSTSQIFSIEPTKDTLLKCSEGTIVYLPANSLQLKSGDIPAGNIEITINEVRTMASIIANNISTTSNGTLIETNGMLHIQAISGTDTLTIDRRKSIVIMFPRQNKSDFCLFYGNKDSLNKINWKVDKYDNIKTDSSLNNVPLDSDTSLLKKYITKTGGSWSESKLNEYDHEFTWKLNDIDSSISNHIEKKFNQNKLLYDYFVNNRINLELKIYLDSKGNIKKVDFEDTTMYKREISNILMQFPPFDLNSMRKEVMTEPYSLYLGVWTKLDKEKYLRRFNSKYKNYLDKAIQKVDNSELNYFIYSSTNLGWINCDRFPIIDGEKGNFIVTTKGTNESKVYLIFKDIKSIIEATKDGNSFIARNVPQGQNVKIIAISYADKKPFIAIENIKIAKRKIDMTNYKEFTLDKLRQELN